MCRCILLGRDRLEPGEAGFAQLRLDQPLAALRGDRFVVRFFSPVVTVGGGVILDLEPPAKGRMDPARLTLSAKDGPALARALEARNLWPEMEDGGHVVLILTGMDSEEDLDRLEGALEECRDRLGPCPPIPAPPMPERVCSPREAMFAPTEKLPLEACAGRVSAVQLAPYPPGVPVVAPGERITEKELAYFRKIGYNNKAISVIAEAGGT